MVEKYSIAIVIGAPARSRNLRFHIGFRHHPPQPTAMFFFSDASVLYGSQHSWPTGSMLLDFHEIYVVYGKEAIQAEGRNAETLVTKVKSTMVEMLKTCPGYNHEVREILQVSDS